MRWLLTCPDGGSSAVFYSRWVREAGAEPVTVTTAYEAPADLAPYDALLLPGGGDIDPALYGSAAWHPRTGDVITRRDRLELDLLRAFQSRGRPVFGICRGCQVINVAFGGGLIQHLADQLPPEDERHSKVNGRDAIHPLRAEVGTALGGVLRDAHEVNSSHHQGIDPQRVGMGLIIAARSGAGVIEALEAMDTPAPVMAVQWHPERLRHDHPASVSLRVLWAELARR